MAEAHDFLFELGTEELPPKTLLHLRNALAANVTERLKKADLGHGSVRAYATPRRLALFIRDLAAAQPDKIVEKRGPAVQAAFAPDGAPTKAAQGFAKGCGTTVDRLTRLKTEKGEWLAFEEAIKGAPTETLIPEIVRDALAALPIAKRMRWGGFAAEFVRPVHWAVLIYGERIIETEILGVMSANRTYGHRFHHPGPLDIGEPAHYVEVLRDKGHVIADFEARRHLIEESARRLGEQAGGTAHIETDLLDEVTALNEWPVAVMGDFEPGFLNLPAEVLITTMQANQKYFPIKNSSGHLLPHFITFSNIDTTNPDAVRQGNERVIRPRLTDAEFFWEKDKRNTLASRVGALSNIVFQNKLGSLGDKTGRVEALAERIATLLGVDAKLAVRAAHLAKADLLSEMVGEFPSLQGTMGRYYALVDGEPEEVAGALEEQYFPRQSGGELPASRTGQILSLAEKIDTLIGIFSAGLIPTGDKDPYALRRAAIGALRIIIEKRLDIDLPSLTDFGLSLYTHDFDRSNTKTAVEGFVLERLKGYVVDRGFGPDEFDAVAAVEPTRPLDFDMRLQAVREFRALPEAESLAAANKRIRNILRKSEIEPNPDVDETSLVEAAEIRLLACSRQAAEVIDPMLEQRNYTGALSHLASLREPVDDFFDHVMVMADDPTLRDNRLGLLSMLESLFTRIADISRLQPSNPA